MDPAPALFPHRPLAGQQLERHTMKKLATLAALAALALPVIATEVTSSNVVGYQKLAIPANGYALLANPFVQIGTGSSTPEGYALNDMFIDDTENSTAGRAATQGDQIQTWDSARQGYSTYFFSSWVNKWAGSNPRAATEDAFNFGDGYWYLNRSDSAFELTVSGEVSEQEVTVTLIANGFTLVCNPFPADLPLNSESINWVSAGATAGRAATQGDQIQIWNTETQGYTTYFFSSWVNQWAGSNPRAATADSIPAGQGFWYLNRGDSDITITLKSPLAPAVSAGE